MQIPARGSGSVSCALLPVKAGTVALPQVALVWDRGINNSATLYEAGRSDLHTQFMFVSSS